VAFNPQGGYVVTASVDGTALGWDIRSGQKVFKLGADGDAPLLSLAISPGGTFAARGDAVGSIRIWEIPAGRGLGEWQHSQRKKVEGLAFSADGRTLASASQDATIKLWDVEASGSIRERLAIPCGEGDRADGCTALAFMKDGHTLGVAGHNGEIRLYETDFDKLFEQARSNVDIRQISTSDCRKYLHLAACIVPGRFTRRAR
jgi:WD40 repeat protein